MATKKKIVVVDAVDAEAAEAVGDLVARAETPTARERELMDIGLTRTQAEEIAGREAAE